MIASGDLPLAAGIPRRSVTGSVETDCHNAVDVTEARDAEEQKTRNRSLAIGPLIFYPDGAG
jgi:hypothetical protein